MASPDLRVGVAADPSGSAVAEAAQPTEQAVPSAAPVLSSDAAEAAAAFEADDVVQLDANKLHCYQVALELHTQCSTLVALLNRIVKDQLERASLSVVLNIAEAGGRRSRRDKARFYAIARGSATEVAALLDVLAMRRLASSGAIRTGRRLAIRCVQMLTRIHQRLT
jgi:four helix bundle protein